MNKFVKTEKTRNSGAAAWQVIYTDLMTIIMVFFVILWSLNQGKDIGVSETIGDVTDRMLNLPGDVLFAPGKSQISPEGKEVFKELFYDETGQVLNFQTGGLTKRMLIIHGHTDGDGKKENNFNLGFQRAYAAYEELKNYSDDISDHAVICTHADNTAVQEVPDFEGKISEAQRQTLRAAKSKNRRITIEDKIINKFDLE
ncbi:OmpA/MotB family protein [Pleionea sediminis]|uniref:OmpA/MotB family protein n=1 Tax=Pleionea sediminis TaxID=2569479 RepID=UPI00197B633B|nr:flagellar motor protein MotB [Pleionea sediminis]